ncbi:predicted protein [Lichtheimia corymbifera JMRC:FSU:9682]|uniref:Uncharacterized protein n=1 Tax=Lichtheimia corymbifera JMRC:FSU:9682 TaxID=1263082 RepID=A0A068RQV8_9FUNG|nr:predicted protein [Lichtheimia corymbifera JMRC:FSU:9682]
MDHLQCAWVCKAVPDQFNFQLFPLPPIPNCCPIQVQLLHANDCPASTHHVKPTIVLIRLSLTEWQGPWRVHPTTTHETLDTTHALVHSSTTTNRNSIHSSSCY